MNKIKFLICLLLFFYRSMAQMPNSWTRVADFGGIAREGPVSFSIDSFGYVGLGEYNSDTIAGDIYPRDLWQYNPYTNTWTQKAAFPGVGRIAGMWFVIGSKAYIGLGSGEFTNYMDDIWEYDPASDTWTQRANFPGGGRLVVTCFGINGKGYAGMGISDTSIVMNDFWEYDPITDSWSQLSDFPGSEESDATLFNIGGIEYIGLGINPATQTSKRDMWSYNPATDSWTQLANFSPDTINGGALGGPSLAFTIGDNGYLNALYDSASVLGSSGGYIGRYFYKYDVTSDTWILKDSFPGSTIFGGASFSIGNKGYAGMGTPSNSDHCSNDFWMYTPDSIATGVREIENTIQVSFHPNPVEDAGLLQISTDANTNVSIALYDMQGRMMESIYSGELNSGGTYFSVDTKALTSGLYMMVVNSDEGKKTIKFTKL